LKDLGKVEQSDVKTRHHI